MSAIAVPATVRIGGMDKPRLLGALRERGVQLNASADALFADPRFEPSERARTIEIVTRTVADLGFAAGATYGELVARAHESGWAECPLELGPHLRLAFLDQPEAPDEPPTRGEAPPGSITIASPPLDDGDETPKGFYLRRADGIRWLRGYRSWPGHRWNLRDRFVFSRME
jgi:hypothetical protein